jgi:hypothetical protein
MHRIYFQHQILFLHLFYIINYCKLYLSVFAIKNSCKIYFTVNPFVFGLYETSQYCNMSKIFSVLFYITFVVLVCLIDLCVLKIFF